MFARLYRLQSFSKLLCLAFFSELSLVLISFKILTLNHLGWFLRCTRVLPHVSCKGCPGPLDFNARVKQVLGLHWLGKLVAILGMQPVHIFPSTFDWFISLHPQAMCKQLIQLKSWFLYMLEISQTPFQVSLFWINACEINAASSSTERTESKILKYCTQKALLVKT